MIHRIEHRCRESKIATTVVGSILVLLLGSIDYLTGPEISFSIFYLLPVSAAAWLAGREAGVLVSLVSAVTWLEADLLAGHLYSHSAIPFWNALVRFCFFLVVTFMLASLQVSRQNQQRLTHFIVHDLKTPLTVMIAGFQLLEDHALDSVEDTWRRVVNHGLASGQQMLAMINSLLDVPRLESGKMPLQMERHQASALIDESVAQIELLARQKRIVLETRNGGNEVVQADRELTTRVLGNLLGNAIKFSSPGARVLVEVEPVDGDMLAIHISDQGPGIPGEWSERVFEKYVQVEAKGGSARLGHGLGLHFCRLAVEAQGGRIHVDGTGENGTTITFTLPLASA